MNARNDADYSSPLNDLLKKIAVVVKGTAIGVFGRWATWPLEKAYYDASDPRNEKPYWKIYRDNLRPSNLYKLNKFFLTTGLLQTIGKSASNMGVVYYTEHYYSHLPPLHMGLVTAMFCAPCEILLTSHGEYLKVQSFFNIQRALLPIEFVRVICASVPRVFWSSVLTFCRHN